jgi:hypothetical protein
LAAARATPSSFFRASVAERRINTKSRRGAECDTLSRDDLSHATICRIPVRSFID